MTPEVRHTPFALSIDALVQQWARRESAPAGSAYVVDSEVAARRRNGVLWWHHSDAVAVAVVVRPEDLDPGGVDLLWLAAGLGAADALDRLTGRAHRCLWPDQIDLRPDPEFDVAVTASTELGPGRVDHGILVIRIAPVSKLGSASDVSSALVQCLRQSVRRLDDPEQLVSDYIARCDTLGNRVAVSLVPSGFMRGEATGIDSNGFLVVTSPTGLSETTPIPNVQEVSIFDPPAA